MDYGLIWLVLLPASLFDLSRYRIPNSIPVAGLVLSLFRHFELHGFVGIETWLAGVIIPGILYYILFRLHAFGASDGKIMSVIGGYTGVSGALTITIYSIIVGALMGIVKLYLCKTLSTRLSNIYLYSMDIISGNIHRFYTDKTRSEDNIIPYSVAITIGTLIYYYLKR